MKCIPWLSGCSAIVMAAVLWLTAAVAAAAEEKSGDTLLDRGNSMLKKGQCDEAIAIFTEAIRLKPDNAKAYCFYAAEYSRPAGKRRDRLILDFQKLARECAEFGALAGPS